jgi:catechol 2,3-dioxygenase-like lactoylglutathione lyase family enzyme
MANEVTIPVLPCSDLDESIAFYGALGFECTYRQSRPNPHAVVAREDIQIHLFGLEDFDPEQSYGNVIVVVADPDRLYQAFAAGLRATYGKLPSAGIPRILRPRKRQGTVRGFSVIDPGGNWLRISRLGDTEEEAEKDRVAGLARVIDSAARQGDSRGDDAAGLKMLENGLARFPDAPTVDRVRALLYRAELAVRLDDRSTATASLSEAQSLDLTDDERAAVEGDFAHATELVAGLAAPRDTVTS